MNVVIIRNQINRNEFNTDSSTSVMIIKRINYNIYSNNTTKHHYELLLTKDIYFEEQPWVFFQSTGDA